MKCHIENLDLYYEVHGEGKPIILLHGWTLDRQIMIGSLEPIFRRHRGWRRFYLDLPGHGDTPKAEWIQSSDDMLRVVLSFIEAIIPNENFIVAGESYGGYLALGLVYHVSQIIDGVLLIAPKIISENRTLPSKFVLAKDNEFLDQLPLKEREIFEEVYVIQTKYHWERYKSEIFEAVNNADELFLDQLNTEFNFEEKLQNMTFDCPSLFIFGRQDHLVGYQDAWKILENYPRATFAVLDRAGHCVHQEQEQLFNMLVIEWLNRLKEDEFKKSSL